MKAHVGVQFCIRSFWLSTTSLLLLSCAAPPHADEQVSAESRSALPAAEVVIMEAVQDFDLDTRRAFPFYAEEGIARINAQAFRDKPALAAGRFPGQTGSYHVTLLTLSEPAGESSYLIRIDGQLLGEFTNPRVELIQTEEHTWPRVPVAHNASVEVQATTHSNGKVKQNGDFVWAAGRWVLLRFVPVAD